MSITLPSAVILVDDYRARRGYSGSNSTIRPHCLNSCTHSIQKELFKTEIDNLALYGYGVKSFMLSMVETIGRVTNDSADIKLVNRAINLGRDLLNKPIEILDGVEKVLSQLNGSY